MAAPTSLYGKLQPLPPIGMFTIAQQISIRWRYAQHRILVTKTIGLLRRTR